MDIHDLGLDLAPIERVDTSDPEAVAQLLNTARKPLIFSGLANDLEFLKEWDFDYLGQLKTKAPIQRPERDGVNYFIQHEFVPMSEVVAAIKNGDSIYIGARKITGPKGKRFDKDGLGDLADSLNIPNWIDKQRIFNANFWLGAGENNTLLHYDAWDSIQLIGMGEKDFIVFPSDESPRMHQYSAFDFKALAEARVLHSKIRPLSIQPEYIEALSKAKGFRGKVHAGEVIFLPAGFWHFVKSTGTNVAVNFFVHTKNRRLHFREPLRTFWVKDKITLWPVRLYKKAKAGLAKMRRYISPRPVQH